MTSWVSAIHGVHHSLQRVQVPTDVSYRGGHELPEGTVIRDDDGGGVVAEPEGGVGRRRLIGRGEQGTESKEIFLHDAHHNTNSAIPLQTVHIYMYMYMYRYN